MFYSFARDLRVALAAAAALLLVQTAAAQEPSRSGGFLDNLFGGNSSSPRPAAPTAPAAEPGTTELASRIDRLEARLRELTGAIEQLQFRNQQLEEQIQRMGGRAAPLDPNAARNAQTRPLPSAPPPAVIPATPARRGDAFDPAQNPSAPGAPQTLGSVPPGAPPEAPIGAPGGRPAGAPLDLSTLASGNPAQSPDPGMPPPPPRNPTGAGAQMATLPPSQTPKDEFDLGYGYIQRKDYAFAEQSLRDFLRKYPSDALAADAQYWLGESLYQRQRYRDAAESFLAVTTKYEGSPKAPEGLLRLGQSLAALGEKETACAAWREIGNKYSNASAGVKKNVAAEQKRARC